MNDFFSTTILIATVASGIRLATPFLLASLGEALGQRSGVLNLGVDGVMLMGAFVAYFVVLKTGNPLIGAAAGILLGMVFGLVYAFITVNLHAEQGVSGIGIYLFGLGMSDLLFQKLVGTPLPIMPFPEIHIPLLADIPIIGPMLFTHSLIVYVAFLLVPAFTLLLNSTTYGMNIRAVGENPAAVDSLGVSVTKVRYSAIIIGNGLAGLAGAALAIELGIFQHNLTNSMGFIAIALVYFGAWRPFGVMAGSLIFGMVAAIVLQGKTLGIIPRSASDLAAMAPAVITIFALVLVANRFKQPAALSKPYERGR
ncbi:ABC transporter permease [Desulfopila aestuarii]|uniref:Simple sugar transport system permease protein n=1 Tax=Desulfopila aestuarii DSM 18488 TaxID=1121416 RepID=A0A1M7YB06_9BACT|nr:ABC transporter permease [Desulfopila aestuarii]SHO49736.1 simple sugar transport system permease protein [Desulfopila aestuarii DSM 18488]